MAKKELRRSLLAERQSLVPAVWQAKNHQICAHLRSSVLFAQARTVLAYFSLRQEPDLSALFVETKNWGFPRCVGKALHWHIWSPQAVLPLQTGAYGILEPHPEALKVEPDQVDLLLVPAVACDVRGYRLGYGGGYYDRLLASPEWADKQAIGIVFDFAYLPHLPNDTWDQPLTAVCTETALFMTAPTG